MNAVSTDLQYVQNKPCGCPVIYKTLWDLLCNQLFTQVEHPWIDTSGTFESVKIWYGENVVMTKTTSPYTFTIAFESTPEVTPKATDIILFGRDYYIIGAVSSSSDTYTCSGCVLIDMSIIGVYAALVTLYHTSSSAEAERVTAEEGRSEAEGGRVAAESERDDDFSESQAERTLAYAQAEAARDQSFQQAEAARNASVRTLLTPFVVPGAVVATNNHFVADSETQTPQEAYSKWHGGYRVHLVDRSGRTEEIIADDGEYLITISGWKWGYTE